MPWNCIYPLEFLLSPHYPALKTIPMQHVIITIIITTNCSDLVYNLGTWCCSYSHICFPHEIGCSSRAGAGGCAQSCLSQVLPAPRTGCIRAKDPLTVCFMKPGDPVLVPGVDHESDSQTKMKKEGESFLWTSGIGRQPSGQRGRLWWFSGLTGGVPSSGVRTAGERSTELPGLGLKQSGFKSSYNTICVTLDKPLHLHEPYSLICKVGTTILILESGRV